ncbi:MAG: hypothetical protein M5R41_19340 [Bacteroidia bacterium]|nr:hypothetical protein [Bacteroidia bacterium]
MSETGVYLNKCIVCGLVEVGARRSVLEDGPPMSLCSQHAFLLESDHAYGVYCMRCDRLTAVLHIAGYEGDKLVFAETCPLCDESVVKLEARSWKNRSTNVASSSPSPRDIDPDDASSSTDPTATP